MMHNRATQQLSKEKTLVLWDIDACPIPDGYDPRLVGPRIESALKKSGYGGRGPLTIIATGDLTQIPGGDKVLRELASTGIALEHSRGVGFQSALFAWTESNPSPATTMLISDPFQLESTLFCRHRILVAYPQPDPDPWKRYNVCKQWLWKTLLEEGEMDSESAVTRLVLPGHQSPWNCSVCPFAAQSFEDLATHLKSVKHAYSDWSFLASHLGVNRFNVKPKPPNNDPDTIKELELLYNADIEWRKKMINDELSKGNCDGFEKAMLLNALTQDKNTNEKTLVMWDINSCPIPDGYDSRLVRLRIESAVKNSGFSGPVTITAIDDLTQTLGDKVLRELSSTGIALKHTKPTLLSFYENEVEADLYEWAVHNPYPAAIMLISGPSRLKNLSPVIHELQYEGYTILLAYPQRGPASEAVWLSFQRCVSKEWLWKSVLEGDSGSADNKQETTRLVLPDLCPETDESPWNCSVCLFSAQSFEDLTTHLQSECELLYIANIERPMIQMGLSKEKCLKDKVKKENNEVTQYKKKKKMTLVLWDINSCPIPDGYDSRLVRRRIESAVKNSGFSGYLTITAFGDLTQTPGDNVLRGLSSTGIALKHAHAHAHEVIAGLFEWAHHNPSPATIMLISGHSQLKSLSRVIHYLHFEGYTILLAYPQRGPAPDRLIFQRCVSKEWLWKSLLEGEMDSGSADKTTRLVLPDNCGETGESPWSCSVCCIACQSFEDFTTHLNMHVKKTSRNQRLKLRRKAKEEYKKRWLIKAEEE